MHPDPFGYSEERAMRSATEFQASFHQAADEGGPVHPLMDGGAPAEKPKSLKSYLGDGVYVDFDGYGIVMTTENGIETTNTIYLEPAVLAALDRYRQRLAQEPKDK